MPLNKLLQPNLIGGKWAISLRVGLYMLPVLLLFVPLTETNGKLNGNYSTWMGITFLSLIPPALILLLADRTWFKDRGVKPRSIFEVAILGAILGALRSLTSIFLTHKFGVIDVNPVYTSNLKILNGAFIGAVAIPSLSLFMSYKEWYVVTRENLINQIVEREQINDLNNEVESRALRDDISSISSQVNKVLYEAQSAFEKASTRNIDENWQYLAELLRKTANDVIRPLSHTLHKVPINSVKPRRAATYLAVTNVFPIYVSLLYGLTTFRGISLELPFPNSLVNFLSKIILVYVASLLCKELQQSIRFTKVFFHFLFLIVFTNLLTIVVLIVDYITNKPIGILSYLLNFAWLFLLVMTTSYFGHFLKFYKNEELLLRQVLAEETGLIGSGDLQRKTTYRNVAKYLHTVVQSRLIASAIALEIAGRSSDVKKLSLQVQKAKDQLNFDLLSFDNQSVDSIEDIKSSLIDSWGSLIDIEFEIKTSREPAKSILINLKQLLDEAISNAFRHGLATAISVRIVEDAQGFQITVVDNGQGLSGIEDGLGMEYFNLIAPKNWKLINNPDKPGAVLSAYIKEVPLAKA